MKNLYAVSIYAKSATKGGPDTIIRIGTGYVFARSDQEANDSAMQYALEVYPIPEWTEHHVFVSLIPKQQIKDNLF